MRDNFHMILKKHGWFIGVAGCCGAALIFYFFIYLVQEQQVRNMNLEYQQEKERFMVCEKFFRSYPDMEKTMEYVKDEQQQMEKMLPNQINFGDYILQIEKKAQHSQVELIQIKPFPVTQGDGFYEASINVTVRGSYAKMILFLREIESGQRYASIQEFHVKSDEGKLEAIITVRLYSCIDERGAVQGM